MAKYIVTKGNSFFYSSPKDIKDCRLYSEGEIVELPEVDSKGGKKQPETGENLRLLSAKELQLTASELKKRELGEVEQPLEQPVAVA